MVDMSHLLEKIEMLKILDGIFKGTGLLLPTCPISIFISSRGG